MKFLYAWAGSRRKTLYVLLLLYFLAFSFHFIFEAPIIIIGAAAATLIIPFLMLVVAMTGSKVYEFLAEQKWLLALFSLAIAFYTALANIYAANMINEVFKVSPGLFPITTLFLTFAYFVTNYLKWLVFYPYMFLFFFGGVFVILIVACGGGIKRVAVRLLWLCVIVVFLSSANTSVAMFEEYLPALTKGIAVKSDFNSQHRCGDFNGAPVKNVLFMPNGSVLAQLQTGHNTEANWEFKVMACKSINSNQ